MINGITSTGSTSAVDAVHQHRRGGPGGQDPMTAVADLLGTTTDDLYEQLSSGTSLSQLAADANVTQGQLLETMSSGMFFKVAM